MSAVRLAVGQREATRVSQSIGDSKGRAYSDQSLAAAAAATIIDRVAAWLGLAPDSTGTSAQAGSTTPTNRGTAEDDAAAAIEELGEGIGAAAIVSTERPRPLPRTAAAPSLEYHIPGRCLYLLWRSTSAKAEVLYPDDACAMRAAAIAAGASDADATHALAELPVGLLALAARGRVLEAGHEAATLESEGASRAGSVWPRELPLLRPHPPGLMPVADALAALTEVRRLFGVPGSGVLAHVTLAELLEPDAEVNGAAAALFNSVPLTPFLVRDHIARPTLAALRRWVLDPRGV